MDALIATSQETEVQYINSGQIDVFYGLTKISIS